MTDGGSSTTTQHNCTSKIHKLAFSLANRYHFSSQRNFSGVSFPDVVVFGFWVVVGGGCLFLFGVVFVCWGVGGVSSLLGRGNVGWFGVGI